MASNNWDLLANSGVNGYRVVLFLEDLPQSAAQRTGFERYMRGGGAWLGFHVSAFTTDARSWPWYHDQFLGSGDFKSNTWGPTTAVLRVEDRTHASTRNLPATFTSSVSEWYSWSNDLRRNWMNTKYRMLYANFGHNAMDYDTDTALSSTFASETQNRFLLDGLKWLGGTPSSRLHARP